MKKRARDISKKKILKPILRGGALAAGLITGYCYRAFAASHYLSNAYTSGLSYAGAEDITITTGSGFSISTTTSTETGLSLYTSSGDVSFKNYFSTGTISSASGDGISAENAGAGDIVINTNAAVSGVSGIDAYHDATSGGISINTSGTVTGNGNYGIRAYVYKSAGDISISSYNVTGDRFGISSITNSSGNNSVTSTGTVKGNTHSGVYTSSNSGNTYIEVNNVKGYEYGIYATALTTTGGDISITSTGTVTGTNKDGIQAYIPASAIGDITINAVDVTGGERGIYAWIREGGEISITSTGSVTGSNGDGIRAYLLSDQAKDISITANQVYGSANGIWAKNEGTGNVVITTNGDVTGATKDGIYIDHNGTGNITVTTYGTVTGSNTNIACNGIKVNSNANVKDIFVTANGDVTGYSGITVSNDSHYDGDITVVTKGYIKGVGYIGLNIDNNSGANTYIYTYGKVYGKETGIWVQHDTGSSGKIMITSSDAVTGKEIAGIVTDYIGAGTDEVNITITETGSVTGGIDGIQTISSYIGYEPITYAPIYAQSVKLVITSAGTITGENGSGIYVNYFAGNSTTADITANHTYGAKNGIWVKHDGTDGLTVTSNGTVIGDSAYGIYAGTTQENIIITVNSSSTVSGATAGIASNAADGYSSTITVNGTVKNISGSITDSAIISSGSTTLTVNEGASITGSIDLSNQDDTFNWNGGTIDGSLNLKDGDDTANIRTSNFTDFYLNGSDGSDTLNFYSVTANAIGDNIVSWETINIGTGAEIALEDYLSAGEVNILSGGTLMLASGIDSGEIRGSLDNAGTIRLADSDAGDNITVTGNYTGSGTLSLDVDFTTLTADTLTVDGTVSASGTIAISDFKTVSKKTETGASGEEIVLVSETSDTDKSDESFTLAAANQYNGESNLGRFENSAFIWKLKTSGNNWVLGDAYEIAEDDSTPATADEPTGEETPTSKPAVVSEIPAYLSLPVMSYEIVVNKIDTLHQRMGELRRHTAWANADPALTPDATGLSAIDFDENRLNGWVKTMYSEFDFDNDDNFALDGSFGLTEIGFDRKVNLNNSALYLGGYISFAYGDFDNDGTGDEYGSLYPANGNLDGKSGGIYATWFNTKGTYVDVVADYMTLDTDLEAVYKYSTDGTMLSGSIEVGHDFVLRKRLIIEPQAQVKVAHISWDDLSDGWNDVDFKDHTYITGRVGIRGEYTFTRKSGDEIKPWLYVGMQDEFTEGANVTYAATTFDSQEYNATANIQAGITADINKHLQFYGDAGYTSDFEDYNAWRVDAGLRIKW